MKRFLVLIMVFMMCFIITACGNDSNPSSSSDAQETEAVEPDTSTTGVRPEFKATMDSYEEFFNEYVEFMKTYKESDDVSSMMSDAADYMTKYADLMEKLEDIDEEELSDADLAYYLEVSSRIMKKLSEVL